VTPSVPVLVRVMIYPTWLPLTSEERSVPGTNEVLILKSATGATVIQAGIRSKLFPVFPCSPNASIRAWRQRGVPVG